MFVKQIPFLGKNPLRNQTYRKTVEEEIFRVFHLLRAEKESIETGEQAKGADKWWKCGGGGRGPINGGSVAGGRGPIIGGSVAGGAGVR